MGFKAILPINNHHTHPSNFATTFNPARRDFFTVAFHRSCCVCIHISTHVFNKSSNHSARPHVCELDNWNEEPRRAPSAASLTGKLPNGKGFCTHDDLGLTDILGVPVHHYRDTITYYPGTVGNDQPFSITREYHFSTELGFNLASTLNTPQVGRQVFTVKEITLSPPDPSIFEAPAGWRIIDRRKAAE